MAQPAWQGITLIEATAHNVLHAPLIIQRKAMLRAPGMVEVKREQLPFYARSIASDQAGYEKLLSSNSNDQVERAASVVIADISPGGIGMTDPFDWITDAYAVPPQKTHDTMTLRIRTKWTKLDTTDDPDWARCRMSVGRWAAGTPPTVEILASQTWDIQADVYVNYDKALTVSHKWTATERWLLRVLWLFKRPR